MNKHILYLRDSGQYVYAAGMEYLFSRPMYSVVAVICTFVFTTTEQILSIDIEFRWQTRVFQSYFSFKTSAAFRTEAMLEVSIITISIVASGNFSISIFFAVLARSSFRHAMQILIPGWDDRSCSQRARPMPLKSKQKEKEINTFSVLTQKMK